MSSTTTPTEPGTPVLARLRGFHPGWYGAVMGTAIVGIVAYQDPGQIAPLHDAMQSFGVLMVGLAALLAIGLAVPYVARWVRHPEAARADLSHPVMGALYATVPAGILVLAVGIATVGPSILGAEVSTAIVTILAVVGITLALVMSVVFAALLFASDKVEPQAANGGWFIPPVVVIIVPMVLVSLVPSVAATDVATLSLGHGHPALPARRLAAL